MAAMLLMKGTLSWALTSSPRDISSAFERRTLLENDPSPALENKEFYRSTSSDIISAHLSILHFSSWSSASLCMVTMVL